MQVHEVSARATTILVVDDTPENIALMSGLLKDRYRTKIATNGEKALEVARTEPTPDLILLDVSMPGMDGYEVCARLKADAKTAKIPVIFLTSRSDKDDERRGLEGGAVDYVTKPVNPEVFLARIHTHLELKRATDALRNHNLSLESEVARRMHEITTVQDVAILALASLAETRDNETGNHIRRTQKYVRALGMELRDHPRFADLLTEAYIALLFKSAPLHDIGKVGIPDEILLKPGKLTTEEFEIMKRHAAIGCKALMTAGALIGDETSFLKVGCEITHWHHEKWDGSGYPDGLRGDDIPISARLMAVADVYDALITKRVYKPAFSPEKASGIIREGRATHFDPDVVDAFVRIEHEFRAIAELHADE